MKKMRALVNFARVKFLAVSENESFARIFTAGFVMHLGVTPSQLADIKTVVSEAVTNSIVHGYRNSEKKEDYICMELRFYTDKTLVITVQDKGQGIEDIEKAMEPFFTTDKENERSGMGFPIMDAFSDSMRVASSPSGTRVTMHKRLK